MIPDGRLILNRISRRPGGRFLAEAELRYLISYAYELPYPSVVGSQPVLQERFVVSAQMADGTDIAVGDFPRPVRQLLADRFRLQVRFEDQIQTVYLLRRVSPVTVGPRLRPSTADCTRRLSASGPPEAQTSGTARDPKCLRSGIVNGRLTGIMTMRALAESLSAATLGQRQVVDETGIQGQFDIDVMFNPASFGMLGELDSLPALSEVLRSELGLELYPDRRGVPRLIVENVEAPTAN